MVERFEKINEYMATYKKYLDTKSIFTTQIDEYEDTLKTLKTEILEKYGINMDDIIYGKEM